MKGSPEAGTNENLQARTSRQNLQNGHQRKHRQRTARKNRRRRDGLQEGAGGGQRRPRQGHRMAARERYRTGRQARRQARLGGLGRVLHPCGRQAWSAGRGQLRERLRRQDARVPDPGQGDRDADRGGQSALRQPRGRARRSDRAGAPDLRHAVGGQARSRSSRRSSKASSKNSTATSVSTSRPGCAIPTARSPT